MPIYLQEICEILEKWAPKSQAASWDHVGLEIGNPAAIVSRVLVSLDVDLACLKAVQTEKHQMVITHHPIFFRPLSEIRLDHDLGQIISRFIKSDTALYTMHTNLDVAEGGVNDCLIQRYGIPPETGTVFPQGFGKWVKNDREFTIEQLAAVLPCRIAGDQRPKTVRRIGFCCGSGKSLLSECRDLKIDVFITGELSYHDEIFCELNGITAVLAGHKETEILVLPKLQAYLNTHFPSLQIITLP